MEEYGFVYIWRDRKYSKYYVGAHWVTKENDDYICSSTWMKRAYNKRPEDFRFKIISKHNDVQSTFDKEYEYLQMIKQEELGKKYYNLAIFHWNGGKKRTISEETKRKIGDGNKGKIRTEAEKQNLREKRALQKQIFSKEMLLKMSERMSGEKNSFFGKRHSEEAKMKMSKAAKGKIISEETKKKISEAKKGKIRTKEHQEKLNRSHIGKKLSKESIRKRQETRKRNKELKELNKC